MLFATAQIVTNHLSYFCNKICCQEIPKIAQSGHTGLVGYLLVLHGNLKGPKQ